MPIGLWNDVFDVALADNQRWVDSHQVIYGKQIFAEWPLQSRQKEARHHSFIDKKFRPKIAKEECYELSGSNVHQQLDERKHIEGRIRKRKMYYT